MRNYQELAEKLVAFGRKNGADQVQVNINKSNNFTSEVYDGEVDKLQQAASVGAFIKVIKDNKVATASSSDMKEETLNSLMKKAVNRAELASPDEFAGLPDAEKIAIDINKLDLFDPRVETISPDDKIAKAKELEKICLADKKVTRSGGAYYYTNIGETILANSKGFSSAYKRSSAGMGVYLMGGEGDNLYEDGWSDGSHHVANLLPTEEVAKLALHRVKRMLGARKIETQNVPVVMENKMAASLMGFLAQCLSGSAIYMKQSFLVDKLNQKIASDNITLTDDPLLPAAPGSRPFDSEGVAARKLPIIENGVLKNYMLDTYSARKLKMKSTGHAAGTSNFIMKPGTKSVEEIIKSVDKGLYLVKTIGQGTVPTSGDISKGAYGIWIENGELTYPVSEITFSGNMASILNNITMIGNDPDMKSTYRVPSIKIAELTLSGK